MSVAVDYQDVGPGRPAHWLEAGVKNPIEGILVDIRSDDFEISISVKLTDELVLKDLVEVLDLLLRVLVVQRQRLVVERNREVGIFAHGSFKSVQVEGLHIRELLLVEQIGRREVALQHNRGSLAELVVRLLDGRNLGRLLFLKIGIHNFFVVVE